ncbi:class I SAM-dependent methyltransferase [Nocardia sp. NBC_00508]|uniref:class I SAM-dependent methyltransferase n=1 Tax=Nocardia sp. NBC_00508 TaxID=2975992 RepID=UPI002E8027F0|nr:class I SAM-dependent methyltransferase [Nocardia sp. NBC_00508]WUD66376.1 class I SAM-dependent methyltransferase [Nocardia sp. NBC_00508]
MMTTFGEQQSRGYDRRATRLLGGLYHLIAADIDAATQPGAWVLDVGTGPGRLLTRLLSRRMDLRLHGVDLSPHMIEIAERTLAGDQAELSVGDVGALPYPDDSFDLVVSSLSLHEWPDVERAIAELARVLRPGGTVAIYDFRFVPAAAALSALRHSFPAATVRRETVRPGDIRSGCMHDSALTPPRVRVWRAATCRSVISRHGSVSPRTCCGTGRTPACSLHGETAPDAAAIATKTPRRWR